MIQLICSLTLKRFALMSTKPESALLAGESEVNDLFGNFGKVRVRAAQAQDRGCTATSVPKALMPFCYLFVAACARREIGNGCSLHSLFSAARQVNSLEPDW